MQVKVGRNDPCPCGSGKKHKRCCVISSQQAEPLPPSDAEMIGMIPKGFIEGTKLTNFRSFVWHEHRWRLIWGTLHHRPVKETFQDFIIGLLKLTLGPDWIAEQEKLPAEQRHVVVRWLEHFKCLGQSPMRIGKGVYVMSGPMKAAESLGFDLYLLQLVNRLPDSLVERLRDKVAFQGARYEVAVAAIFARAGFAIELLDEKVKKDKHCEFVATHKLGTAVCVEAKSRRRVGVLNEPGKFDETRDVKAGVRNLYQDARTQGQPDKPFLIFIDANRPTDDLPPPDPDTLSIDIDSVPWMTEIRTMLKDDWAIEGTGKSPDTAVVVTNFAPHYGEPDAIAPLGIFAMEAAPNPRVPLTDNALVDDLFFGLRYYAFVPREV